MEQQDTQINIEEARNEIESQMDEAIKLTMSSMGLEIEDPEVVGLVKAALRKKLDEIASNIVFYSVGQSESEKKVLKMKHLKSALQECGIKIDRPDYILEQQQSQQKMTTRRAKNK